MAKPTTPREEASKSIEQHARLTATVAQAIARKSGFAIENVLEAIRIEARQIVMRQRRRNGFDPPANDGTPPRDDNPPAAANPGKPRGPPKHGAPREKPRNAHSDPHTHQKESRRDGVQC